MSPVIDRVAFLRAMADKYMPVGRLNVRRPTVTLVLTLDADNVMIVDAETCFSLPIAIGTQEGRTAYVVPQKALWRMVDGEWLRMVTNLVLPEWAEKGEAPALYRRDAAGGYYIHVDNSPPPRPTRGRKRAMR